MTVAAPSAAELERFRGLVEREFGFRFDEGALKNLHRALIRRLAAHRQTCQDYLNQFDADPAREILALAADLTVGETYFLRHIEQFQALTRTALPELLRAPGRTAPLRILSAGCSTGEETYSLAIALRENGIGSGAFILGVDINPASLARARSGRYTDWSLRSVPQATQERWFTIHGEDVVVDPAIHAAVRFEQRNFAQDDPELWRPESFDVVFCRNVIMYFRPEVMAEVVSRIARSLIPGGYLFLGSAETLRGLSTEFDIRESQGTFYYQRRPVEQARYVFMSSTVPASRPSTTLMEPAAMSTNVPHSTASSSTVSSSTALPEALRVPAASTKIQARQSIPTARPEAVPQVIRSGSTGSPTASADKLEPVMDLLRRERFTDALALMDEITGSVDTDPEAMLLRAALLTHSGSLPAAERTCHRLLEIDTRSAGAHVLLAVCREEEQDLPAAVDHCRTAITFDPEFAMPHVHLGRLARRLGDLGTARRQYAQSARLLPSETNRRILLFGGGFDREALISLCRTQSATGETR